MGSSPHISATTKKLDVTSPVPTKIESPKQNEYFRKPEDVKTTDVKELLAPPPRRNQQSAQSSDYFIGTHSHLASEANPFDFSFAGGNSGNSNGVTIETPGGTRLPPVSNLTSPAGILGPGITGAYWNSNSLRSGPLSPAMIGGPQKSAEDYFADGNHIRDLRTGFITANESHVRAGLTPGGSGTIFPELVTNPSPPIYNTITNSSLTPSGLDFHRVTMNNTQKRNQIQPPTSITSQPQEHVNGMDVKPPLSGHFDDANAAASGLYLLAQSREDPHANNQYAVTNAQISTHAHPLIKNVEKDDEPKKHSPILHHRKRPSTSTASRGNQSASDNELNRPQLREKPKKLSPATVARRKPAELPSKVQSTKKLKSNNGTSQSTEEPPSDDETGNVSEHWTDGKKTNDEEKRKNFLERNRIAALKCRQRKKQWLNSLQAKVEVYASENEGLNAQIQALRDEIVHIKTLLLAHKECPVSVAQGISGMNMHQLMNEGGFTTTVNPYGISSPINHQQQHVINSQAMQQRRYS